MCAKSNLIVADVDEARLTEGLVHVAIKVSNERSGFGMLGTQEVARALLRQFWVGMNQPSCVTG